MLVDFMQEMLPSLESTILDDAVCAALSFIGGGSVAGHGGLLYIGIGSGVGGAYVPPSVMRGPLAPSVLKLVHNVELGHQIVGGEAPCTCGRNGCVQAYARADSLTGSPAQERELAVRAIATAAVNLAEVLPISLVMLGGGALSTADDFGERVQGAVTNLTRTGSRPLEVSVSPEPERASLVGARLLALSPYSLSTLQATVSNDAY